MQTGQIIVSKPLANGARHTFFERDVVAFEEAPHRSAAAGNFVLAHRADYLIQRQVRLILNQRQ